MYSTARPRFSAWLPPRTEACCLHSSQHSLPKHSHIHSKPPPVPTRNALYMDIDTPMHTVRVHGGRYNGTSGATAQGKINLSPPKLMNSWQSDCSLKVPHQQSGRGRRRRPRLLNLGPCRLAAKHWQDKNQRKIYMLICLLFFLACWSYLSRIRFLNILYIRLNYL